MWDGGRRGCELLLSRPSPAATATPAVPGDELCVLGEVSGLGKAVTQEDMSDLRSRVEQIQVFVRNSQGVAK